MCARAVLRIFDLSGFSLRLATTSLQHITLATNALYFTGVADTLVEDGYRQLY